MHQCLEECLTHTKCELHVDNIIIGSEEDILKGSEKSSLAREEVWRDDRRGAEAR